MPLRLLFLSVSYLIPWRRWSCHRDTKCVLHIGAGREQPTRLSWRAFVQNERAVHQLTILLTAWHRSHCENTDLAVEAQKQQHDKEEDGPEGWHRHHGHSFGVGDEGQARTWKENIKGDGEKGRRWELTFLSNFSLDDMGGSGRTMYRLS